MKQLVALLIMLAPLAAQADKNYMGGKGATWDCKSDPVVNINHGKGVYTFKGACKEININGGENKVTIESVGTFNLNGGKSVIDIGAVDAIQVVGSDNKITYKKGLSVDAPAVNQTGSGNSVGKK